MVSTSGSSGMDERTAFGFQPSAFGFQPSAFGLSVVGYLGLYHTAGFYKGNGPPQICVSLALVLQSF